MKIQAIIFDLDGTIADTQDIWKQATCDLIHSRGVTVSKELSEELERQLCGMGLSFTCSFLKNQFGLKDSVEELINEKKERAGALYQNGLTFIDGFIQFHKTVSALGIKSGVATNSSPEILKHAKLQLNLETFFGKHLYDVSRVQYKLKPDPAIYLYAAQQLNVPPENCIAIDDSPCGITSAQKAGMFCFGINTASVPDLIQHADLVIDSYDQIDMSMLFKKKGDCGDRKSCYRR